ncbi:hypothetical protein SAMN05421874_11182 [Nonomuraea maritima]|uniref:Uncharacterized protein n=1 Tax=Nonomuraea maritima TaxID=683260 RepID=A0A1G9EQ22_9ACTN|nr:hypothetical protein SAMN05421874_11182 [Nonomuraea maritima]
MGNESVLCPVCRGVLPASGKGSYTAVRGRLIVSNGYCAGGCAEVVEQPVVDESQVRTQEMARTRPVEALGVVVAR